LASLLSLCQGLIDTAVQPVGKQELNNVIQKSGLNIIATPGFERDGDRAAFHRFRSALVAARFRLDGLLRKGT